MRLMLTAGFVAVALGGFVAAAAAAANTAIGPVGATTAIDWSAVVDSTQQNLLFN
ncbi:Spy/CpxP family protein refolding chaperone [Azospirillum lipoferum]|uniref:hypothetical protein n=1 Tax=Azospirillum TaxID=191 RepID=UPI00147953BD|nr:MULTISPECIES: hypothetical protein [Azospirillum]MCP1610954.1 Spy/CpxP family protein refolding chaperone [Azospirillum lipoferum]MDW5533910.1 hypothetical protein [Azospirillum sp. NL1]